MQSTHKISGDAAAGFADYLTADRGRGDYYLGGEADGERGRWHGSPRALSQLGVDRSGRVERAQLLALMRGLSPRTGAPIRAAGGNGSRVAGIDVTLSAPKSVSALWAVSSLYRRAQIEAAHRAAVASTLARIESDVELVRRRVGGVLRWERAQSLVAAEFVHTSSRLTRWQEADGVPDPQLHSHVVVLAAERTDGAFAAVDSRELYRSARENGAWYRAELAFELGELGLAVRRRTGRDGRYFEVGDVPDDLARRWSSRTEEIDRAARRFRQRYGRAPRAGELGALTVATRGTKSVLAQVDVDSAWRAVGEEYGLNAKRVAELFSDRARHAERSVSRELLADVTRDRSALPGRELRARAYEVAAGVERPRRAERHVGELARGGELVALEGGWWTTRDLRELEQRTLAAASARSGELAAPVSERMRAAALDSARARLGAPLSREQAEALSTLTGRGGVVVMVGQAGTGKGVVIGAARDAWERDGHRVVGSAVAGATAKRLGADAGVAETMTVDALVARHEGGSLRLDRRSVVVVDEAAMADTRRLGRLVEITGQTQSKLVLVGDQAQLSPLGAGGLFSQLRERVPSTELREVHRARENWEREAWGQVRCGDAERALAAYNARDRLHVADTRVEAGERMVADWAAARAEHPGARVVMLTDASNEELDRLNALAQQTRVNAGELGARRAPLPGRPYDLRAGDDVLFTGQLRRPGEERVENGTPGEVVRVDERAGSVLVRTGEPHPRDVEFSVRDFSDVRLAYAQHVYKAQGLTVDRGLVLAGGWQTDRERAYVALTRARDRTDVYVSREDLGEEGMDAGAIERLAARIGQSRAQQASVTRVEVEPLVDGRSGAESEIGRALREMRQRELQKGISHGIE